MDPMHSCDSYNSNQSKFPNPPAPRNAAGTIRRVANVGITAALLTGMVVACLGTFQIMNTPYELDRESRLRTCTKLGVGMTFIFLTAILAGRRV